MAEYIEREALLDSSNVITVQTKEYGSIEVIPVDGIAELPTADVAPIVRGEWAPYHEADIGWDEYGVRCSKCRLEFTNEEFSHIPSKYCPNCGAKMMEV